MELLLVDERGAPALSTWLLAMRTTADLGDALSGNFPKFMHADAS
jgi:hypothetical protein